MTAPVVSLADHRRSPAHPPGRLLATLPTVDRTRCLLALAREWEGLVDQLSVGRDSLSEVEAEEALQGWAGSLVHPLAVDGLPLALAELRVAVKQADDLRDGWLDWSDLGFPSRHAAECHLADEVQGLLWRLLTGLRLDAACHVCMRVCGFASAWQPLLGCTEHSGTVQ